MAAIWILIAAILPIGIEQPVDYDNQIIPILTKAGCNTGACHGAAVGRGGFKLSLYGGDPTADYQAMALELEGRRVNLARPEESLVLLKPTESIAHGGGTRLEENGPGADLLLRWVREGAHRKQSRQLKEFEVQPQHHVVASIDATVPLSATARFEDGTHADVTQWTVFTPEDSSAVEIHPETAQATLLRRGRHIVVARYLDRVVPIELFVPIAEAPIDHSREPRHNFIDDYILELLSTLRIPVSPEATDLTFFRRASLDLTGRLPTLEMTRHSLADEGSFNREAWIDRWLASEEFTEYWTLQLAELLRIRSQPGDSQGALAYHRWLKQQIADRVPYDQLARAMLTAMGDTHEIGPANYYRTVAGAREQAEFTSELFMGSRLRCANCHNHPLDRWTQDDYHGLAAIFARMQTGRVIKLVSSGEITHPRTGEPAVPRIPGEEFLDGRHDQRQALATWLTDRDNPYFARAIVNRLWKAMMGRGLVEPTDDLRATNPATHPALLERLAADFVEHGYDLRHTLRTIALSSTYARSSQALPGNQTDDRFYSHALVRPLQPHVLADALYDITGVADRYGDEPLGTRAVALFDPALESQTLDVLGRCSREESCEGSSEAGDGLSRMLHLFNGPLLNRRIESTEARLSKLLDAEIPADEIIDEFYQRALGRLPDPREQEYWGKQIVALDRDQMRSALEDFMWSLLSCREFITNH